jgi:cytochrome bd-type quinol oxidase subunit 2
MFLTALVGSAGAILLYGIAWLLSKHGHHIPGRSAAEWVEVVALVLALLGGVEFAVASFGRYIAGWIRDIASVIPAPAQVINVVLFLIALALLVKVVLALSRKAQANLGTAFFLPVLLGSFAAGTWPAVIYGYLVGPANAVTDAIMSHI